MEANVALLFACARRRRTGATFHRAESAFMDRRSFLHQSVLAAAMVLGDPAQAQKTKPEEHPGSQAEHPGSQAEHPMPPAPTLYELEEVDITALQSAMESGKYTSRSITEHYLKRIEAIDGSGPAINSIIELNPDALSIAQDLDAERKAKGPRGPLHGIPVLVKDNLDTGDRMQTTAGSLALAGKSAPHDSFVVRRLREAGVVLLGKTNLSEWANIRSSNSTSGWSGRGGQTRCPYALDRNPSGSSSGSGAAIAASLAAVAIGTETDGSITSPSNNNCLVGIKPTIGLVSRSGIVPISHSQDTAGPMARTVRDAAIVLSVIAGIDVMDPVTTESRGHTVLDYTQSLDANGLRGARIGVVRRFFGFSDAVDHVIAGSLEALRAQGAVLVDPVAIPSAARLGDAEFEVLLYELKADLNAYLAGRGDTAAVHSLQDVIVFNELHAPHEMPYFGQDTFLKAEKKGPLTDKKYLDALAKCRKLTRADGIDMVMKKQRLDALVAPTGGPAWTTDLVLGDHGTGGGTTSLPAVAGYPHITVPAGYVFGLPVGLSFFGRAYSEPTLLKFAYAFEQATKVRRAPKFLAAADLTV